MLKTTYLLFNLPRLLLFLILFLLNKDLLNKDLNRFINYGTKRNIGGEIYSFFCMLLYFDEYRNVFLFRQNRVVKKVFSILMRPMSTLYFLTPANKVKGGLLIIHGFSTIVNAESIGENCTIYQQCTIGYGNNGKPVIGDNVTIYAGAIVVGNITIGDNCVIGAGTTVTKSIPANTICVGQPFRALK